MNIKKILNVLTAALSAAVLFLQTVIPVSAEAAERFDVLWSEPKSGNIAVVMVSKKSGEVIRMRLDTEAISKSEADAKTPRYDTLRETGRLPAGTVLEIEYETVAEVYPAELCGIFRISVLEDMCSTTVAEAEEVFASLKELGDTADYNIPESERLNFSGNDDGTILDIKQQKLSDNVISADYGNSDPNPKTGPQGAATLALAGILVWTGCVHSVKRR